MYDQKAIERKIDGLLCGKNGYEKDWSAFREFNELLVEKGDPEAIKRKIEGLTRGGNSFRVTRLAEGDFYFLYYTPYGLDYRISSGLRKPDRRETTHDYPAYGYQRDPLTAREFIENLSRSEISIARVIGQIRKGFRSKVWRIRIRIRNGSQESY